MNAKRPARQFALGLLVGVVALALGLVSLWHPIVGWPAGAAHKSDVPPVLGVGFLVVPVVLAGVELRRRWEALTLVLEARRERRRRPRA